VLHTDPSGRCTAPGQGDDYCHTDNETSGDRFCWPWTHYDPYLDECIPDPPPPTNELPPFDRSERDRPQDIFKDKGRPEPQDMNNTGVGVIGGRRRGDNEVLAEAWLLACYLAMLNALERVGPTTWPRQRSNYVTVYRFADRTNPETLRSNLSRQPQALQDDIRKHMTEEAYFPGFLLEEHAAGRRSFSPFVSVVRDHVAASRTRDRWLSTIIWGQPGYEVGGVSVQRAPDLGTFSVPAERLFSPSFDLSTSETEMLFLGDDLGNFLKGWIPNPYYGPRLPPGHVGSTMTG
jgi:hypothetical protein